MKKREKNQTRIIFFIFKFEIKKIFWQKKLSWNRSQTCKERHLGAVGVCIRKNAGRKMKNENENASSFVRLGQR